MRNEWMTVPLLLLALAAGACGGGPEGAMDDLEEEVEGAELGPDTAGPGWKKGMGAGSVMDTLYPPTMDEAPEPDPDLPDADPDPVTRP